MIRNTILLLLIIFTSSKAFAIDFEGKFRQGHFIIGKTQPETEIWIDKKKVKVSKDGFFAFGIGRDRKYDIVITSIKNGKKIELQKKFRSVNIKFRGLMACLKKK